MRQHKTKNHSSKVGLAPGSLYFTGEQKMETPTFELITFDENNFTDEEFNSIENAVSRSHETEGVCWLNVVGLHDISIIEFLVEKEQLHKLSGEDILSIGQRPKIDEYESYIHVIANMIMLEESVIATEQLSILIYEDLIISFQEVTGDVFDHVRKRLKEGKGQIRKRGADYLGYALLDALVDQYFVILEHFGDQIEALEETLLVKPSDNILTELYAVRRKALQIRRSVYPMREVVSRFEKIEHQIMDEETKLFIRDLYDHTIQSIETVEVFRDSVSGLVDLYLNSVSNRMNNVMKVLTIVSTIFIPLTFIAGIYGMNFTNMPELEYRYGYLITIGVMVLISILMIIYFKRKKWL